MAKFKLRIFRSCRSKHLPTLPEKPVSGVIPPPPSEQHRSSAFRCRHSISGDHTNTDNFQWHEDDQWHVVANICDFDYPRRKIYNSSVSDGEWFSFTFLPLLPLDKRKKRRGRSVKSNRRRHVSSEHTINVQDNRGRGKEETKTLIASSRSISTDFNPQFETISEIAPNISSPQRHKFKLNRTTSSKPNGSGSGGGSSPESGSPARLSACKVEGKMKESFAVVKNSKDLYEYFRNSMIEMIMEKEMFEERDLEELLHCLLWLNSKYLHGVIVEAFMEICNTMFRDF